MADIRNDANGKRIVENARVRLLRQDEYYGTTHTAFFAKNNIYGTVMSDQYHTDSWAGDKTSYLSFKIEGMNLEDHYRVRTCNLEVIPRDEYEKYDELHAIGAKLITEHHNNFMGIMTMPNPTVNFNFRKFNYSDLNLLSTCTNCIELGNWDRSDGRNVFHVHNAVHEAVCCSFTKTTNDLQVYIPKLWLNYYGYLVYDLVEWLKFLKQCEIGFDYEFFRDATLSDNFNDKLDTPETIEFNKARGACNGEYTYRINPGDYESTIVPTGHEGYHMVRMKGSDNKYETYLRFICLRYIYNHQYWTIPGHAMQIKQALGEEVTHWQALLMAHLHHDYHYYYSFGLQKPFDPKKAHKVDKEDAWCASNNYSRYIYPFQDPKTLLERVRKGIGMNMSIDYICDAYLQEELDKFFQAKDYVGLYWYLREKDEDTENKKWHLLQPLPEELV